MYERATGGDKRATNRLGLLVSLILSLEVWWTLPSQLATPQVKQAKRYTDRLANMEDLCQRTTDSADEVLKAYTLSEMGQVAEALASPSQLEQRGLGSTQTFTTRTAVFSTSEHVPSSCGGGGTLSSRSRSVLSECFPLDDSLDSGDSSLDLFPLPPADSSTYRGGQNSLAALGYPALDSSEGGVFDVDELLDLAVEGLLHGDVAAWPSAAQTVYHNGATYLSATAPPGAAAPRHANGGHPPTATEWNNFCRSHRHQQQHRNSLEGQRGHCM